MRGGRRHVASAPEPNVLELSGLVVGDLVGGAVGRYKKVESRFNGRPVYEDVVRKDRYIYYLSEYGGIWSVGFEVGSKAVALFNRSEAEEPQLASLSWSKYVGRTETNAAKFAVDEAIKLSKVLAEDVVVEDAPGGSDAAAEAIEGLLQQALSTLLDEVVAPQLGSSAEFMVPRQLPMSDKKVQDAIKLAINQLAAER